MGVAVTGQGRVEDGGGPVSKSAGVAVVSEVGLLRQGLGLQLRLAGVEVVRESPSVVQLLTHLDAGGARIDTAVVVDVRSVDPPGEAASLNAAGPLLARGTNVVLIVGCDGTPITRTTGIMAAVVAPDADRGAARLVTVSLAEMRDVRDLTRLVRALPRHPRSVTTARPFTRAEFTIHALIAQGYSNAGIASLLGVSRKTVECHVSNVFAKLDLAREDGTYNRRVSAALRWSAADHTGTGAVTSTRIPAGAPGDSSMVWPPRLALTSRPL